MKIIIPGEPIPKSRPRFFSKDGRKLAYNNQSNQMTEVSWRMKRAYQECEIKPSGDSYDIHLAFFFRPPPGKDCNLKLWGLIPHTHTCDLDNLEKFYLDCGNGILYEDDAQITVISSSKHYSSIPRTEITLMAHKAPVIDETVKTVLKLFSPEDLKDFYDELANLGHVVTQVLEMDEEAPELALIEGTSYDLACFSVKWGDRLAKIGKLSIKECPKKETPMRNLKL